MKRFPRQPAGAPSRFWRRTFQCATGFFCGALCTGWFGGHPGIAIVNLETGRVRLRSSSGSFNETPIDVDETSGTFRTLQRTKANGFLLRTVDFEGKTKAERTLPAFDPAFDNYGSTWSYAISPDGSRIAYVTGQSHDVRVYDFRNRSGDAVMERITTSNGYCPFLFWLPNGRLAAGAHVPGEAESDRIVLIDLETRKLQEIARPCALELSQSVLSGSRRYLACWEGLRRAGLDGQFVVYDLASGGPVATVKALNGDWLSQPRWAPDERRLAYVEGARRILFYSIADGASYLAAQAATNELVSLYAFGNSQVVYKTYQLKKNRLLEEPLRIRDIVTGKEREISGVRITGDVFLAEHGTRLIAKVGF